MDKAWCIPFKADGESKKVKNKKVNSTSRGDGACIDCGAVQVMHCWWCALYWSIFFNDARRQIVKLEKSGSKVERRVMRWRSWVMAFNPVSSQQGRRLQSRCIICYSLMIEVLVFLSSMMQQCRQWKGCIGALGLLMHCVQAVQWYRTTCNIIWDHQRYEANWKDSIWINWNTAGGWRFQSWRSFVSECDKCNQAILH